MWRRARSCEPHTRESYDPNDPNKSDEPDADESYDPNELSGPDEFYDSGQ